jgi:hypothetical protein
MSGSLTWQNWLAHHKQASSPQADVPRTCQSKYGVSKAETVKIQAALTLNAAIPVKVEVRFENKALAPDTLAVT